MGQTVELMDRSTVNPDKCGARPCVRGMRIRVIEVLDLLAVGLSAEQVVEELPDLELADVAACWKAFESTCCGCTCRRWRPRSPNDLDRRRVCAWRGHPPLDGGGSRSGSSVAEVAGGSSP